LSVMLLQYLHFSSHEYYSARQFIIIFFSFYRGGHDQIPWLFPEFPRHFKGTWMEYHPSQQ